MTEYPKRKPFLIPIEGYRHMSRSLIRFCGGAAAETAFDVICVGFLQLQAQYGAFVQVDLQII